MVDKVAYRPAAKAYEFVFPKFFRLGIHNVLANVAQVPVIVNDVLQLNVPLAMQDIGRLGINSTLGVAGWFDVAKHMGAPHHDQDFGLTMAKYGWKDSSYLLLPFFPVGTPRDLIGVFLDYTYFLPWAYVQPVWIPYTVYAVTFIDKRASLLPADQIINESFDPYIFIRDAYMQRRKAQIERISKPFGAGQMDSDLDEVQYHDEKASPAVVEDKAAGALPAASSDKTSETAPAVADSPKPQASEKAVSGTVDNENSAGAIANPN